jgi:hypothetical protein
MTEIYRITVDAPCEDAEDAVLLGRYLARMGSKSDLSERECKLIAVDRDGPEININDGTFP